MSKIDQNELTTGSSDSEENSTSSCTCSANPDTNSTTDEDGIISLTFLSNPIASWIEPIARAFEQNKQGRVRLSFVQVPFTQLFPDIINEAKSQIGLYDGFLSPPLVLGSIAEHAGWADLRPFIQESDENLADWSDILLGYRQAIAQYEDQIVMHPLDGDILTMYYRKDVLDYFGLPVPRTWDEYIEVAKATHGKVWENKTLSGSCIGRVLDCAGPYWANLLLSSMTQAQGASTGHLFDINEMTPLTGPAFAQSLLWMSRQVQCGPSNEFEGCHEVNTKGMTEGECVLTYNWGNTFKQYLMGDSVLRGNRLGVAPTPGSTHVLDRETMTLVPCDEKRCKYGEYYEDLGWVNRAPYLAFGGWSCAVNNYTNPVHKRLATEFCAFASSGTNALRDIIPNATSTEPIAGQDPFRASHLNVELYVSQGYERIPSEEYLESIQSGIGSGNVVTDIRFPSAPKIYTELDRKTHDFLKNVHDGLVPESELENEIDRVVDDITRSWEIIIQENDATATIPALEVYQRIRGVYSIEVDNNYLDKMGIYGNVLVGLILLAAILFMCWTFLARKSFVVRASQPFFLALICAGAIILGSSIITLGLDDGAVGEEAASRACMATPWLMFMGWSLLSSALGAKLHRVNIVYQNALRHKKVLVTTRDVALPLAVTTVLNITLLLVWNLTDPAYWERDLTSETESIGKCRYGSGSIVSLICFCLLGAVNGGILLYTNVQAYRARHLASEYGESQQIAMAMGSILQIIVISVPLLIIVEDNPVATYFLRCSIVFVASMSILCLIFVPKIYSWCCNAQGPLARTDRRQIPESGDGNVAVRFESREVGCDVLAFIVDDDDLSGMVSFIALKHARSFLKHF